MTGRLVAIVLALLLLATVTLALLAETARGDREQHVITIITDEFGRGQLGACFLRIAWRESRLDPRAANWGDIHSDGSRGSFGLFAIGALWRRPTESVGAFAVRMYDPAANARLAHELFRKYGIRPWGGC